MAGTVHDVTFNVPSGAELLIDDLHSCLQDGKVVCDWPTIEGFLIDHTVSDQWWDLTETERRSISEMAIKNTLFYDIRYYRTGEAECKGGKGDYKYTVCLHNAIIRYMKFGTTHPGVDNCYYKHRENSDEFCYVSDTPYGLPCYLAGCVTHGHDPGFGHALAAIQVNEDVSELESWIIFQYSSFDIKPGDPQLPVDRFPGNIYISIEDTTSLGGCGSYKGIEIARWEF